MKIKNYTPSQISRSLNLSLILSAAKWGIVSSENVYPNTAIEKLGFYELDFELGCPMCSFDGDNGCVKCISATGCDTSLSCMNGLFSEWAHDTKNRAEHAKKIQRIFISAIKNNNKQ